jgi:signal transduction histidine kinase
MTLAIVAGVLLLLGFIWNPRAGFSGLGSAIAQHVLTMGMPLEDWLDSLAVLAQRVRDAELFLTRACEELPQRLPGVTGGRWEAGAAQREFGHSSHYPVSFVFPELTVELSCRVAPGPALRWQYGLAVRLLAELYGGKCQARELQRMSQVEAVHETGARLTHDIKNLLQSLDNLCAAGVQAEGDASGRFQALLRRQLPEISNRLRHTLVKLRAPQTGMAQACSAAGWFRGIAERAAAQDIGCSQENIGLQDQLPDEDLFASVAENLLQNILDKRHRCPELQATCRLFKSSTASATATATATATASASAAGIVLEMTDDGPAIDPRVVRRLFRERLESSSGLGIGLYQSARLAEEHGYQLVLTDNRAGCVCFRLEPKLL